MLIRPSLHSIIDSAVVEFEYVDHTVDVKMKSTDFTLEYQYHLLKHGKFDPYVSVSPGFTFARLDIHEVQRGESDTDVKNRSKIKLYPVLALMVGKEYHLNDKFSLNVKGGLSKMMLQTGVKYKL